MVRGLHEKGLVWYLVLGGALLSALVATSCIVPTDPPEYREDAAVNYPPHIEYDADPSFTTMPNLSTSDKQVFTVTVDDPDREQSLQVRFCVQENADLPVSVIDEQSVAPAAPGEARKPVVSRPLPLCQYVRGTNAHFLFVTVTDGAFSHDCQVTAGSGKDTEHWFFTCTDI